MSHFILARLTESSNNHSWQALGILLAMSCGKTNFSGQNGIAKAPLAKPVSTSAESTAATTPSPDGHTAQLTGKGVEWFWQCATAPVPLPAELSNGRILIEGKGPHKLARPQEEHLSLHIRGFLCPPINAKRDIAVVVDVSSSTSETDPVASTRFGTPIKPIACERKRAVKALLSQLAKQPAANLGFVTFSSEVKYTSQQLSPASSISESLYDSDGLCAATGGTNYADALTRAAQLLDSGRQDAVKEIYFITDGEPDSEEESRDTAANVRGKATIATVMFGGKDSYHLKNEVASKDASGKPIHAAVTDVKNLATTLEDLSKSIPVKGTFKYKSPVSQDWHEADLWQFVHNGVFDITELKLDSREYASGISFSYTYEDNRGIKVTSNGDILWD